MCNSRESRWRCLQRTTACPHFRWVKSFTLEQQFEGSRNEFIQSIQDVHDKPGVAREYMNYTNESRTGKNIKQVTHGPLQFAKSDPKWPVYLSCWTREVMEEEEVKPLALNIDDWGLIHASALPPKVFCISNLSAHIQP